MYTGHISNASNRADWQEAFVLVDEDTGELIDISLCRITLTVADRPRDDSYGYYNQLARPGSAILTGSTDTGEITLPELGTFMFTFSKDRMAGLCQGAYQIGVRISQDDRTVQLIIGTVNIDEGIDRQ